MLLCARPHVKDIPFDTARFIVGSASGVKVNGQQLVMGDEIPKGALSVIALQQIYDTPLRLIETVEYAREIPGLVKACELRNTSLEITSFEEEQVQVETSTIQDQNEDDVRVMCDECGHMFADLSKHSKRECKKFQKKTKRKEAEDVID